ncbi:MAG: hypothetical protein ACPGSG_11490 [Prolixibacteraceae bacterium]
MEALFWWNNLSTDQKREIVKNWISKNVSNVSKEIIASLTKSCTQYRVEKFYEKQLSDSAIIKEQEDTCGV